MKLWAGIRVLAWRPCGRLRRGHQIAPRWGERRYIIDRGPLWVKVIWEKLGGYRLLASLCGRSPAHAELCNWEPEVWPVPIKRKSPSGEMPPVPALTVQTKILMKCHLLMEFITATAYEDGTVRTPGYFTIRNRTIEFECTLYDPDGGVRCAVRARDMDNLLAAVETLLGAEDAVWEQDQYLMSRRPKSRKK